MPGRRPEIFVSATSQDLHRTRDTVSRALLALGCVPVAMDHFPPATSTVREMLRQRIDACDAVIHLAGMCYGREPKTTPGAPRRSYTQMEYDMARELNKPVYTFVCPEDYDYDPHPAEPDELRALQAAHREQLQSEEHIYEQPRNTENLLARVSQIRFDRDVTDHTPAPPPPPSPHRSKGGLRAILFGKPTARRVALWSGLAILAGLACWYFLTKPPGPHDGHPPPPSPLLTEDRVAVLKECRELIPKLVLLEDRFQFTLKETILRKRLGDTVGFRKLHAELTTMLSRLKGHSQETMGEMEDEVTVIALGGDYAGALEKWAKLEPNRVTGVWGGMLELMITLNEPEGAIQFLHRLAREPQKTVYFRFQLVALAEQSSFFTHPAVADAAERIFAVPVEASKAVEEDATHARFLVAANRLSQAEALLPKLENEVAKDGPFARAAAAAFGAVFIARAHAGMDIRPLLSRGKDHWLKAIGEYEAIETLGEGAFLLIKRGAPEEQWSPLLESLKDWADARTTNADFSRLMALQHELCRIAVLESDLRRETPAVSTAKLWERHQLVQKRIASFPESAEEKSLMALPSLRDAMATKRMMHWPEAKENEIQDAYARLVTEAWKGQLRYHPSVTLAHRKYFREAFALAKSIPLPEPDKSSTDEPMTSQLNRLLAKKQAMHGDVHGGRNTAQLVKFSSQKDQVEFLLELLEASLRVPNEATDDW